MKSLFLIILIILSGTSYAKKQIDYYDRNGDQYDEEKQTTYKKGYYTLKVITEIDSNKDKKVDKKTTTYYHHDKMKSYAITKIDTDHDGNWDHKEVKIAPILEIY